MDVDSFIGVKSRKAKGKRLSTYDIDTLTFIEPELPPQPEPSEDADDAAEDDGQQESVDLTDMIDDEGIVPVSNGGTPIEIIRPDADDLINPEQLDLFGK